jgi:hypothetical protein
VITDSILASDRALELIGFAPQLYWDAMTAARACTGDPKLM